MDRLTFSTKFGAGLWECPNFSCGEICKKNDCKTCPIQKAFDRLADYEDADEQGRLIELPFSFGDTIYEVYESEHKVIEWTVTGFSISPNGTYVNIGRFGIALNTAKIGDTVFKTREEAEAKLKEMEDDHDNATSD